MPQRWLTMALFVVAVLLGGCSDVTVARSSGPGTGQTVAGGPPSAPPVRDSMSSSSISTSTSTVSATTAGAEPGLPILPVEIGAFGAVVRSLEGAGNTWESAVSWGGDDVGARIEYLAGTALDTVRFSAMFVLPDAGSYLVTDGREVGWYEHDVGTWEITGDRVPGFDPIQFLGWHREPGFSWMELCAQTETASLGSREIAGLHTEGIECRGAGDTWRLWIAPELGVLLRAEIEVGVRQLGWPPDFEVASLTQGPAFPADWFVPTPPEGVAEDPRQFPSNRPPDPGRRPSDGVIDGITMRIDPGSRRPVGPVDVPLLGGGTVTFGDRPAVLLFAHLQPGMVHPDYWDSVEPRALEALERVHDEWGVSVDVALVLAGGAVPELAPIIAVHRGHRYPVVGEGTPLDVAREALGIEDTPVWVILDREGRAVAGVVPTGYDAFFAVDRLLAEIAS